MTTTRQALLITACLLGAGMSAASLARPAYAQNFSTFAEDEDVCRQAGTAAIQGASGPAAAKRYDLAHWRCMVEHARMRQMDAYQNAAPPGPGSFAGRPDNFDYPDAYYAIPYATPGYGYDGFSP